MAAPGPDGSRRKAGPFPVSTRRPIQHPLLRLAARSSDFTLRHRDFQRLVRRSLSPTASIPERRDAALGVLADVRSLSLGSESEQAFLHEWLPLVISSVPCPQLLLAQVEVELDRYGLAISPWPQDSSNDIRACVLPGLVPHAGTRGKHTLRNGVLVLRAEILEAMIHAVDLMHGAVTEGELASWSPLDCAAAVRVLVLYVLFGSPVGSYTDGAAQRLEYFQREGLGVWQALAGQAQRQPQADTERLLEGELDPLWDARLQRAVLLELQARVRAEALGTYGDAAAAVEPGGCDRGTGWLQVVQGPIPPSSYREDQDVLRRYESLLQPLPVAPMPEAVELARKLSALTAEFPWAETVVQELTRIVRGPCLLGVRELVLSPVLLVGFPGCGKSRLVRRLAQLLELPFLPLAVGGMHDSKVLTGTARGWSSGEPSPLLGLMLRHRSASALVLLDELDKVRDDTANSPALSSVLLGMLEPETAVRWYDRFLQTTCDLSRLGFWATANGLAAIPKPLLSRFTVVYMPEPRPEHREALVRGVTEDIERAWGLPQGVLPIAPSEVVAHAGRNVRELRRCVLHYLDGWAQEVRAVGRMH